MNVMAMRDPVSRRACASLLKKVALGWITKDECESAFLDVLNSTHDPVVFALYRTLFDIGGENEQNISKIFVKGSEMRHRVCRWIMFLRSVCEYQWPKERLAPGLRDLYAPTWFDKIFRLNVRIAKNNRLFFSHGDYDVWPFLHKTDFDRVNDISRNHPSR